MTEMTLDRALEITSAICARSWATDIDGDYPQPSLVGISLREMLEACEVVEASNVPPALPSGIRVIHVVPDPRLVAAVYAFEHYEPSARAILAVPGQSGTIRMLAVIDQQGQARAAANG